MSKLLGKLTELQLIKWQHKLLEVDKSKLALLAEERYLALLEKDLEIARLKSSIFKHNLDNKRGLVELKKQEYAKCLDSLEKEVGFKLEGNFVDDVTLEVREDKE